MARASTVAGDGEDQGTVFREEFRILKPREKGLFFLINGMSTEVATTFCIRQCPSPDQAGQIVGDARKRIAVAAVYTRDEQLGKTVMRLENR